MPLTNRVLAVSLVCCFVAGSLVRAADVLQAIPDTSLAIVLVNRPEETSDKIDRIAKQVGAPQPSVFTMLRVQAGIHDGMDDKRTVALAVLPPKDAGGRPQAALLLPVTDYKKFLAQLQPDDATKKFAEVRLAGQPMLICQQGDFAVLAAPEDKGALEDVLNSVKDVSADMSPLRTWLGEVDAAAVGTPAGIKYGIEQAQFFLPLVHGGALGFGQPAAGQQQAAAEMFNLLEQGLKSVGTEVTHLALGLKADENANLRIAGRVRFTPGGEWSNAVKGIKTPKEGVLAGLPVGPYAAVYGMVLPAGLRDSMAGQIATLMKVNPALAQLPPEQQARLTQATIDMMAPIDSVAMSMGVPKAGEPLYSNVVMVVESATTRRSISTSTALDHALQRRAEEPAGPRQSLTTSRKSMSTAARRSGYRHRLERFQSGRHADIKPMFEKMFGPATRCTPTWPWSTTKRP